MGDRRLFPWERPELPEGVHLGEAPEGGLPRFTFADHLRGAQQVLRDWVTEGEQEGYYSYLITEDYAREDDFPARRDPTCPKPIRRAMAMIYRDVLPAEMWSGFLRRFRAEPLLLLDVLRMDRDQIRDEAWGRRRHMLAIWEQLQSL